MSNVYITLPIDNSALCSALVTELIRLTETTDGMDRLIVCGCDPNVIDTVRQLKTREMIQLGNNSNIFSLHVSIPNLEADVRRLSAALSYRAMLEYFIRNGASKKLVASLWKMSLAEVANLRRVLLPNDAAAAAKTFDPCKPSLRGEIQATWYEIKKDNAGQPLCNQIYLLHQRFSRLSIESVYRIAKEFGDVTHRPQGGVPRVQ